MENSVKIPKSPKVLMISPYFVPRKRVGALRSYKFAKYLKDLDWQVRVIHLESKGQQLSEIEKKALEGVGLFGLKTPFDRTINRSGSDLGVGALQNTDQVKVGDLVKNQPKSQPHASKTEASLPSGSEYAPLNLQNNKFGRPESRDFVQTDAPIQRAIDGMERYFPMDTWYPLLRSHLNYMEQILIQEQPDLLWVTADPWSGLSVVRTLSKRLGIPFIVDFRDPFTLCPIRSTKKSSWVQKVEKRLETKVIQEAAAVVFTARETLNLYQKSYSSQAEKMHVIHNAFDTDLFNYPDDHWISKEAVVTKESSITHALSHSLETSPESVPFKLLFLGKFRSSSPIEPLIESFRALKRNYPEFFTSIRLYHIGTLDAQIQQELDGMSFTEHFISLAPIPYDKVPDFMEEFDGLISLLNPARNMVIPSKFWDYLPATPPIISIGTNNEMKEILTATQRGYQFESNQTEEIAQKVYELGVQRGVFALSSGMKKDHFKRIARFSAEHKTRELSRLFLSVINK